MNRDLEPEDSSIEPLLKEVGARGQPPDEIAGQVRAAVHAEWRAVVEQRSRRKRMTYLAVAAGIVCAVFGVALLVNYSAPRAPNSAIVAAEDIATVVKINGDAATGVLQLGHCLVPGASAAPQLLQRSNRVESTELLVEVMRPWGGREKSLEKPFSSQFSYLVFFDKPAPEDLNHGA